MIKATIQRTPYCTEMTFPCTETQLSTWLDELRMNPEHLCPAATITQIEPAELSILEDCEVSLDALNYLAKRMDGMSRAEQNQFFAALTCDELDIGWGMKNIINLTFNLDRFTLIEDTSDLEKVGLTHQLNIRGAISASELEDREWLVEDGKKLLDSGKGIQTEYGLLFVNREIEFEDFYNGTTFPGYFCDPDAIANVGIFYHGITEYVELPCEEIAIKKALCRLGAENIKACKLEVDSSRDLTDEWWTKIRSVENTKDIFGLNNMLKTEYISLEQPISLFNKEVSRVLRKNDFTVSENSGCINVYSDGIIQAKIFDSETISAPRSSSGEAYFKIKDIARTVSEYCSAYEKAPVLKAESLSDNYRCLSEFNGTVLAAKNTEYGFEFVTWDRSYDNQAVCQGNYYKDYAAAKENFATRSGLIDKDKLFSDEQLERLRYCVKFALENDENMSLSCQEALESLKEKINEIVPEQQQSSSPEMSM